MSVLRNVSGNLSSLREYEASFVGAFNEIPCCDQLLLSSSIVSFLKGKKYNSRVRHFVGVCSCVSQWHTSLCVCFLYLYLITPCSRRVHVCVCVCVCASQWHMSMCVWVSRMCIYIWVSFCVYVCILISKLFSVCVCEYMCINTA
jgi:hypothetical protein